MEAYITHGTIPTADILRQCLRKGTLNSAFTPVLCGSSYKNKGVQQVLDAVVDYLPAPTDVPAIKTVDADGHPIGERKTADDEPFSALAFKVINDVYGALTFIRVYSGVLVKGASVQNSTRGKREKIGRMVEMFAKEANPIEEARAGDIIALVSLADTETGDTLCDAANPVVLERMRFPDPVISVSVKSKVKAEQEKFGTALGKMVRADPSLHMQTDRETGETILRGMGELHLEVTLDRMRTEFGVEGTMGEPQVAYRETITRKITEHYIHKKQTGGSGQFAEVVDRFRAAGAQRRIRVRRRHERRLGSEGVRAGGGKGSQGAKGRWRARSLSYGGFPGDAHRWQLSRCRLQRTHLRDRGEGRVPRGSAQSLAHPPRARDEGRNGNAGRPSGRCHRRLESSSRHRSRTRSSAAPTSR